MAHQSVYSYRAKLGLIIPPTNSVNEAEWARLVPQGVTVHSHRMALHAPAQTDAEKEYLVADIAQSVRFLAQAQVDVVAYACTAGSMVTPAASLPDDITRRTQVQTTTTAAAIIAALQALNVERVAVATPYHAALNDHEVHFLADHGIIVTQIKGLGLGANGPQDYPLISRNPLETVEKLARSVVCPQAQALLITCTDFPSLPLIPQLESEFNIPVISSNTATLWASLRHAKIMDDIAVGGRLFQR